MTIVAVPLHLALRPLVSVLVLLLTAAGLSAQSTTTARDTGAEAQGEVRGMWVQRSTLASPEAIDAMVRLAVDAGLNTLLVQVRGRGEAFYQSELEPRATQLGSQPDQFDPLARVLARGHAAGLRVHAWVNVNLVASAVSAPVSSDHVARRHPEWLMVPRDLARPFSRTTPRAPEYVDTLARWTRANAGRVEGLYVSPLVAGARDYTAGVIRELVERYPLDGLHLDYIRFPSTDFDYGAAALSEFRRSRLPYTTAPQAARLDAAALDAPTAWADALPEAWAAFRRDQLTDLVARIATEARARRPGLQISAAVVPELAEAEHRFQDWPEWARRGYLDAVCPMAYTPDADVFSAQIAALRAASSPVGLWAGIGAYRLTPAQSADHVRRARRQGADGVLLFSYDNLGSSARSAAAYLASLRATLIAPPDAPPGHR